MERIAHYTLLQRIASSETSEISLAKDGSQNVALKRTHSPANNASDHAAWGHLQSDEFAFAAALRHENIVSVYDSFQEGSSFVNVMEWVDGYDLRQIVEQAKKQGRNIPPLFAAYIVGQVARGLHFAHNDKGGHTGIPTALIHRDLNLSSVMVSKEGAVKVLNQFGRASLVAKATVDASRTAAFGPEQPLSALKAQTSSLSPEYLTWGVVDQRHDVFALGVILYELLTGQPPFGLGDEFTIQKRILTEEPTHLSVWNPNLPEPLASVVMYALAKDPNQRYANALDFEAELNRCIQTFPKANVTATSLADLLERFFPEAMTEVASALHEPTDHHNRAQESSSSTSPSLTTISSVPPTGQPFQKIGKYDLYKEVGDGGQATVYKAWHTELQSWVAIKLLKDELVKREGTRERFKREARLQFRLQHPHLVRVIEILEESGSLGMVMDWIDGEDLEGYLQEHGKLSYKEIKDIFFPVLAGVGFAHRHNIVHRDLKPSNILLDRTLGSLIPKVTDFGIAKSFLQGDSQTKTGVVLGTPTYIAPEQAKSSKHVDHRADIYALGITLYQMLTGTPPFVGGDFMRVIVSHINQTPPSFASLGAHHPAEVEAVVMKAIRKDPSERFKTCQDFARALDAAIAPLLGSDASEKPLHTSPESSSLSAHDPSQTIQDLHLSFPINSLPTQKASFHDQETHLFDEPLALPSLLAASSSASPSLLAASSSASPSSVSSRRTVGIVSAALLSIVLLGGLFFALTRPSSPPHSTTPKPSTPRSQTASTQEDLTHLHLHLSTTPSGANIYIDSALIGPSPTVLVLKKRKDAYQLAIRHPSYQTYEKALRVRRGAQKYPLHIQLSPLPK